MTTGAGLSSANTKSSKHYRKFLSGYLDKLSPDDIIEYMSSRPDAILILDFGGQYCHLIGRRIREKGVYSEIVSPGISEKQLQKISEKFKIKGIVLSGGPSSVYEKNAPRLPKAIFRLGLPILGLCYGHQLLAYLMGGKVIPVKKREYGISFAKIKKASGILNGLKKKERVWMSHGDAVLSCPPGFKTLAETKNAPVAAMANSKKHLFGIQWHPEVVHTPSGNKIFKNFLFNICRCKSNWQPTSLINEAVKKIKERVGTSRAIVALSGGVDSSVVATLGCRALGKRLTAVFVDHGLMREGEVKQIAGTFKNLDLNFVLAKEKAGFLKALKGVKSPERKRKIIGREFIKTFERIAKEVKADYLLQGTIYPDRIESGYSQGSVVIKTHHNVGGVPRRLNFKKIIEPLKDLYKDEVRKIAKELGLPKNIISRQPFPGPGLAIRIIGEITEKKLKILRKADKIVREEIGAKVKKAPWQYFAVLLEEKTTGVQGDKRAYGNIVAVRAVESKEAMTANFSQLPWPILEKISSRLVNEIPQVTRVVYDITNKPPATIEWE